MSYLHRLLVVVGVLAVVAVIVLPVMAQDSGVDVSVPDLGDEVGCSLWRSWCREQARIAAISLDEEIGCMQWRCWCHANQ